MTCQAQTWDRGGGEWWLISLCEMFVSKCISSQILSLQSRREAGAAGGEGDEGMWRECMPS